MSIYLLHFDRPFGHARHYLGFADGDTVNLERRMKQHGTARGAKLMVAVKKAGITWQTARIWPDGTRTEERRLKNCGGSARQCPICKADKKVTA